MAAKKPSSRITATLPPEVVGQLDFVASRLRCSRSALLAYLLPEVLGPMSQLVGVLPETGEITEADARRARGESGRILGEQIAKLFEGAQDDLFSGR